MQNSFSNSGRGARYFSPAPFPPTSVSSLASRRSRHKKNTPDLYGHEPPSLLFLMWAVGVGVKGKGIIQKTQTNKQLLMSFVATCHRTTEQGTEQEVASRTEDLSIGYTRSKKSFLLASYYSSIGAVLHYLHATHKNKILKYI